VAYALVGGGAALGLALGTAQAPRGRGAVAAEAGADPGQILLAVAVLLLWVGWLEPRLLDADAEAAAALVLLSWAAAVGAALVGALFGAVFRGGGGRLEALMPRWGKAVAGGPPSGRGG
jgi:protein-S-isoprenylcysteine O-methyltransferase Ste14